jgi:hypothetical protein
LILREGALTAAEARKKQMVVMTTIATPHPGISG